MYVFILSYRKVVELIKNNVLHEAHNFTLSAPSETKTDKPFHHALIAVLYSNAVSCTVWREYVIDCTPATIHSRALLHNRTALSFFLGGGGTRRRSWLRHCATSWEVPLRMVSSDFPLTSQCWRPYGSGEPTSNRNGKKVKQSRCRPGVVQRVPGS